MTDFIFTKTQTEIALNNLEKENLVSLVLSLQSERDKFIDKLGQRIDKLASTVDNLLSKLPQVESSLVVIKTVNKKLLKRVTLLERGLHSQEHYSKRECFGVVGISSSADDNEL